MLALKYLFIYLFFYYKTLSLLKLFSALNIFSTL